MKAIHVDINLFSKKCYLDFIFKLALGVQTLEQQSSRILYVGILRQQNFCIQSSKHRCKINYISANLVYS